MLPRKFRLTKHQDIVSTIHKGAHLTTPYTHIYHRQGKKPHTRIACIVSKKVSPSAVQRHQYQRWLRQSAKDFIHQHNTPYDMVFIARPKIFKLTNQKELQEKLNPYLSRL